MANISTKLIIAAEDRASRSIDSIRSACLDLARSAFEIAGGAVVFTKLTSAVSSAVPETQRLASETLKLQRIAGMTAESASELIAVADQVGVSFGSLEQAVVQVSRKMGGLRDIELMVMDSSDKMVDVFEKFGIQVKHTDGSIRQFSDIFEQIRQKIQSAASATEKMAIATQFFRANAVELMPLLNMSASQWKEIADDARKYGIILTQDNVNAVRQYIMAQRDMDDAVQGFKLMIGKELIPALTDYIKVLTESIGSVRRFAAEHRGLVIEAPKVAISDSIDIAAILGAAFAADKIMQFFRRIGAISAGGMAAGMSGGMSALPALMQAALLTAASVIGLKAGQRLGDSLNEGVRQTFGTTLHEQLWGNVFKEHYKLAAILKENAEQQAAFGDKAEHYSNKLTQLGFTGADAMKKFNAAVKDGSIIWDGLSHKWTTLKDKTKEQAAANKELLDSFNKINEALGQFTEKVDSLNPAITEQEKAINSLYKEAERVFKEIDKLKLPSWARQEMKSKIQIEFDRGQSFIKERAYQDELKKTFEIQKEGALKALEEEKKAAQSRLEGLQEYRNSLMQVYDYAIEKANQYYSAAKQAGDISKEITEYLEGRKARPMSPAEKIKAEKDAFMKAVSDAMNSMDASASQKAFEMGKAWLDKYAGHKSALGFADMFDTSQVTRGLETLASHMNGIKVNTEQAGNAWVKYANEQASAMQTVDLWIKHVEGSIINLDMQINQVREIKIETSGAMASVNALISRIEHLNSISNGVTESRSNTQYVPNYHGGTYSVPKTGIYNLLEGERVLNRTESANYDNRKSVNITINPTINITGGSKSPEQLARELARPLNAELQRLMAMN